MVLPTSSDDELGTGEWSAGASLVIMTMPGNWVLGSLISNVWDVSGSEDVNFFTWQPIINYNLSALVSAEFFASANGRSI